MYLTPNGRQMAQESTIARYGAMWEGFIWRMVIISRVRGLPEKDLGLAIRSGFSHLHRRAYLPLEYPLTVTESCSDTARFIAGKSAEGTLRF
jgi:hypothetical protein